MASSQQPDRIQPWYRHRAVTVVRVVVGVGAAVVGAIVVLVVAALGHCSAFGGRCPRGSAFDAEVFWSAASATAAAVAIPVYLYRPSTRRLVIATLVGVLVGLAVGAAVTASTAG